MERVIFVAVKCEYLIIIVEAMAADVAISNIKDIVKF
jgi:hypothetical protein